MRFELFPILDQMKALYLEPISIDRFNSYLKKLQGNSKDDLKLQIMGFNPMAKEHVLEKISILQSLNCEKLMDSVIEKYNATLSNGDDIVIKVVLNLADDLKGAWTNYFTTDYDSKFKIGALVNRNFCAPYFYSSEQYTKTLIQERTLQYMRRTYYWKRFNSPRNLEDFVQQEIFASKTGEKKLEMYADQENKSVYEFFTTHKDSDAYSILFNFFYGDSASQSLGYPSYGITNLNGFAFAKILSSLKKRT